MYVALVHNHPTWKNCQVNPAMLQGQKLWTPTVQDVFKTAQVCKVKPKDSSKYFLGDQDYPNMLVCIKGQHHFVACVPKAPQNVYFCFRRRVIPPKRLQRPHQRRQQQRQRGQQRQRLQRKLRLKNVLPKKRQRGQQRQCQRAKQWSPPRNSQRWQRQRQSAKRSPVRRSRRLLLWNKVYLHFFASPTSGVFFSVFSIW